MVGSVPILEAYLTWQLVETIKVDQCGKEEFQLRKVGIFCFSCLDILFYFFMT